MASADRFSACPSPTATCHPARVSAPTRRVAHGIMGRCPRLAPPAVSQCPTILGEGSSRCWAPLSLNRCPSRPARPSLYSRVLTSCISRSRLNRSTARIFRRCGHSTRSKKQSRWQRRSQPSGPGCGNGDRLLGVGRLGLLPASYRRAGLSGAQYRHATCARVPDSSPPFDWRPTRSLTVRSLRPARPAPLIRPQDHRRERKRGHRHEDPNTL